MNEVGARKFVLDQKIARLQALGGGDGPPLSACDQNEIAGLIYERNMLDLDDEGQQLSPTLDPERQLWLRVIKQACDDVNVGILDKDGNIDNDKKRIWDDARAWFTRAGQDFRVICERAGLHPDFVRATGLARMEGS